MRKRRFTIQVMPATDKIANYKDFVEYAALISNLFTFYLAPVLIKGTQKLLIEFAEERDAEFIFPEEKGESIYTIRESFLFAGFKSASPLHQKELLIERVYSCLLKLYQHLGLNSADVDIAYQQITNANLTLSLPLCGGMKHNKNKTVKALVTAEHLLGYTILQVAFLNEVNGLISKVELFKTAPVYYTYAMLINTAKWVTSEVFVISNKSGEFTIQIKTNGCYTVAYYPKQRDMDGVKEEIRYLTQQVLIDL